MAINKKFGSSTLRNLVRGRVGESIPIKFGSRQSFTDGNTITVADLPDSADDNIRLTAEVHAYHEAKHVEVLRGLVAKKGSGVKTLEDQIKLATKQHPPKYGELAGFVLNVLEDIRIDNMANEEYPGTTSKYREVGVYSWSKLTDHDKDSIDPVRKLLLMLMYKARDRFFKDQLLNPINRVFTDEDERAYAKVLGEFEEEAYLNRSYSEVLSTCGKIVNRIISEAEPPPPPPPPSKPESGGGDGDPGQDPEESEDDSKGGGKSEPKPKEEEEPADGSEPPESEEEPPEEEGGGGGGKAKPESEEEPPEEGDPGETEGGSGGETEEDPEENDDPNGDMQGGSSGSEDPEDNDDPNGNLPGGPEGSDDPNPNPEDDPHPEGGDTDSPPNKSCGSSGGGVDGPEDDPEPESPPEEKFLSEDDIEDLDTTDVNWETVLAINAEAGNYYQVADAFKVTYKQATATAHPDWAKEGSQFFSGRESQIRQLMLDENAPQVKGGLRKGKRLDTHSLHNMRDVRMGKMPRVWKRTTQGTNVKTALMISIDESGSMKNGAWVMCAKIVASLTRVLDTVGVKYAVNGWTGDDDMYDGSYGNTLREGVLSRWYHRWDGRLDQRLLPQVPLDGSTPSVEGMRIALEELDKRDEQRKVLFFFTDGDPGARGVGSVIQTEAMGDMVRRAVNGGVHCFGFGIGLSNTSSSSASMNEVFGTHWVPLPSFDTNHAREYSDLILLKLKETLL